jgi:hypothetical protein
VLQGNTGINTTGSSPDSKAILDLSSTTKGFLPPRLTEVQIGSISSPPEGLTVYNTTYHTLVFFNGTTWERTDGTFNIGQIYGGGIIFYLDGTGRHGLIAAMADQASWSTEAQWGCYGTPIATSTAIGSGQANTTAIISGCSTAGIAARICDDLVLNGFSDWFLPSLEELNQMYLQKAIIGGFADQSYWSSSQYTIYKSFYVYFLNAWQGNDRKDTFTFVRAIRSF